VKSAGARSGTTGSHPPDSGDCVALQETERGEDRFELSLSVLEAIAASVRHALLISDGDGGILSMNPAALALHGIASAAQCPRSVRAYSEAFELRDANGQIVSMHELPMARAARGELVADLELHACRRDTGKSWSALYSAKHLPGTNRCLFMVTIQDITERRRIEAVLSEVEENFSLAIEVGGLGTWHAVPFGPLEGSARFREVFGLSDGMTIESFDSFLKRVHPDDREAHAKAVRESLDPSGDGRYEHQYRWILPDGSVRWISACGMTRFAQVSGIRQPVRGAGTVMDVTDRRQAEERLAGEKERLAVTLRSIGDAVIATDERAHVTLLNAVAEQLTGYGAGEAVGRPVREIFRIIDEKTRQPAASPVDRVLRDGVVDALADNIVLAAKNGTERPIANSGAPIRDASGHISGVVLVFRDQTAERRAQAALLRSQSELLDLVEKLPIGVFVDRGGRIAYANPMLATLLGYSHPSQLVGKGLEDLLALEDRPAGWQHTARSEATTQEPIPPREWQFVRTDGRTVTLEGAPTRGIEFDGRSAVLWTVRDLTDLKSMQAQLMQADRLASVGMLASGVAHEINNPLAYLIASLDFIDEKMKGFAAQLPREDRAELCEALADACEGAARVKHVVRDLRIFCRTDEQCYVNTELRPVIESSLSLAFNVIKYRARLVKEYGQTPPVLATKASLGQVFLNLLVNAAQSIPEGSVDENEIRVSTRTDELGRAIVEVRDSGSGISPEVVPRIFDPFFTTQPAGAGTGLGLSICKNIVAALGGEIRVESRVPGGSLFRVALPAAPPQTDGEPGTTHPSG